MEQTNSSTSSFKRFFLSFFSPYLIALLLFLIGVGFLFEKLIILRSEISGAYKINRSLHITDPEEIPILGSSRAQGGYIPTLLGNNIFNYGIDGTGFDVELFFLKNELNKNKTSPIILNVDMEGFYKSTGDLLNYLYNSEDSSVIKLVYNELEFIHHIPVLKYYGKFEWYLKYYLNERMGLTKHIDRGGSFELNKVEKRDFERLIDQRKTKETSFKRDALLESELESLIKSYPHRIFIMVTAPYHSSYFSSFLNKEDFHQYYNKLAENDNVSFLDFSNMELADSCFTNTTHVNYLGATIFSDSLRKRLEPILNSRQGAFDETSAPRIEHMNNKKEE